MRDLENRPVTRMSPRRSYPLGIAIAVGLAMLMAGCASSPEAGPTEATSKGDAGTTAPSPQPSPTEPATPPPSSARAGSLAYGVDGDIYVAKRDGSNAVRIADGRPPNDCRPFGLGEYWGEGPIWSPDGRYLAYRHTNCDGPEDAWRHVVISDREGNVIAQFPGDGWDISWSPDSTRVAVWVTVFETIGVFGLDGERQALLTMPRGWRPSGDHDPMWLADGESLVLQGVVIPIDGSAPYHLQFDGTYSPDESRVVYVAGRSLVVAEADGSNPRVVFDDWVSNPVWSPTGDRIAFTSKKPGSATVNELRVLDVASGTVTLLAEVDGSDLETDVYFLLSVIDFSPEGDRILFARMADSLWSINADGSDPRRVVAGSAWGDWLSPSPTP